MPESLYDMRCNYNIAYHKDSSGNEYFGYAARGVAVTDAAWQILKMEVTSMGTGTGWVLKWASGDDLPTHIWNGGVGATVENLTYALLGKR
jgi:hypothetical protein